MTEAIEHQAPNATAVAIRKSLEQIDGALVEFEKIEAGFADLEAAHPSNLACDVTTTKGMKEAIAGRAAWREPRIATEKARKAGKAPVLALGKDIDARAAAITERLEAGEANYHEQIKVEEFRKAAEAEEKRLAEVKRRESQSLALAAIRNRAFAVQGKSANVISGAIVTLHTDEAEGFGLDRDYSALGKIAVDETREKLRDMHQAAIEREAEDAARKAEAEALAKERAELQRLRAEQDARDREAAAEKKRADEAAAAERRNQDEASQRERVQAEADLHKLGQTGAPVASAVAESIVSSSLEVFERVKIPPGGSWRQPDGRIATNIGTYPLEVIGPIADIDPEHAWINIGKMTEAFGFAVTADFIVNTLGFQWTRTEKAAKFWTPTQFEAIKRKLAAHVLDATALPF